MNLIDTSVKRPVFVVMLILSIMTLGVIGYTSLPVDLYPSVEFPSLNVTTTYEGASSNEMETLITKPLENALATVEGLDTLSSTTREGQSRISVSFKYGVDIKFAELKVREKVESVLPNLPDDLTAPRIRRFSTDDMPIMVLSLKGDKTRGDLTEMIKNDIQNKVEAIDGVGGITIFGGLDKVIQVVINKQLLMAKGISYNQLVNAISTKNISMPVGTILGIEKNISVRVLGKAADINEIGNITLKTSNGRILRIKDVAKIDFDVADESMRARVDGQSAVLFAVYKQSGENTVRVAENVKKEISGIEKELPYGSQLKVVNDSSLSIKRSIKGVQDDILLGAFLAIVIVWLFLGNFRSTIITAAALPNSLLGAFFLVSVFGFTINTITLLSLSLAVGLLVDDSIVVRENIYRYIENGFSPKEAALKGTKEVALSVISTTFSIFAVFIPISFLKGTIGQYFKQFGLTVVFALVISLLDAFTSAPMLSAYWFKKTDKNVKGISKLFSRLNTEWDKIYNKIRSFYQNALLWALNKKLKVVIPIAILFILSIFISGFIGQNFMNYSDNGAFSISFEIYPGAPLDKTDFYVREIENFLKAQKEIETFYAQIGDNNQSHTGQINVTMKPIGKRKLSTQDVIAKTRTFIRSKFETNLSFRVSERSSIPGVSGGNPISINIYGNDFTVLEKISQNITSLLSQTPGVIDINSTLKPSTPELVIKLDPVKAESIGISAEELGTTLKHLVKGVKVSTYALGDNDYDIVLRLNENERKTVDDFHNIPITLKTGKKVYLSSFCSFTYSSAPLEIRRESNQRIVRISANLLKGHSLTKAVSSAKEILSKNLLLPSGYKYEFIGTQKDFADLQKQMITALFFAILFMYMILASLYNSFIQPLYLMLSIPLAIIGSFLALILLNIDLDLYGYIGILLVFGIVAKNSILLIDFTNTLRKEGLSIRESLLKAVPIRLRPILMTSFSTMFGMLPLALGLNEGSSGRQALPLTVIGGLFSSTFLTLFIIPIVYEFVEKRLEKRKKKTVKT